MKKSVSNELVEKFSHLEMGLEDVNRKLEEQNTAVKKTNDALCFQVNEALASIRNSMEEYLDRLLEEEIKREHLENELGYGLEILRLTIKKFEHVIEKAKEIVAG